jgi:hypothetical protein
MRSPIAILSTLILILLFILNPVLAGAELYQYKDKKGVLSFTNNLESIPKSFRGQAKRVSPAPADTDSTTTSTQAKQQTVTGATNTPLLTNPSGTSTNPLRSATQSKTNKKAPPLSEPVPTSIQIGPFTIPVNLPSIQSLLPPGSGPATLFRTLVDLPVARNSLIVIVIILFLWGMKLWIKNMILKFIARIAVKIALVLLLYVVLYYLLLTPKKESLSSTVKKTIGAYSELSPLEKADRNIQQFNQRLKEEKKKLDATESDP